MRRATDEDLKEWYGLIMEQKPGYEVEIHIPLGELFNPKIEGFVWAWRLSGCLNKVHPITGKDRFNAQGLEGKVIIPTNSGTAYIVAQELPKNRINIYIKKPKAYPTLNRL